MTWRVCGLPDTNDWHLFVALTAEIQLYSTEERNGAGTLAAQSKGDRQSSEEAESSGEESCAAHSSITLPAVFLPL